MCVLAWFSPNQYTCVDVGLHRLQSSWLGVQVGERLEVSFVHEILPKAKGRSWVR